MPTATRSRSQQADAVPAAKPSEIDQAVKLAASRAPGTGPATPQPPEPPHWEPDGQAGPPLILLEGDEGSGRTYITAQLTGDSRIGEAWWLELGEVSAREYAAVPGARYKVLSHDGTYPEIYQRVKEVRDRAVWANENGKKPVMLAIDTMGAEWEGISNWVNARAKNGKSARERLARDPDAEIDSQRIHWNDGKQRHRALMRLLLTFPGPVVMICRGKEVSATGPNGQPIQGKTEYKVEGEKSLTSDATMWIRMKRGGPAEIIKLRSIRAGVRVDEAPQRLPKKWTLADAIFGIAKYDPAASAARNLVGPRDDITPEEIRDQLAALDLTYEKAIEIMALVDASRYHDIEVDNEEGETETLESMSRRRARQLWDTEIRQAIDTLTTSAEANALWEARITPAVRSGMIPPQYAEGVLKAAIAARIQAVATPSPAPDAQASPDAKPAA
jgi:hypothetical protein